MIGGSIPLVAIVEDLNSKYGLEVPIYVAEHCTRELVKDGALTYDKINNRYFITENSDYHFDKIEQEAQEKYKLVINGLQRVLLDECWRAAPDVFLHEWLDKSALSFLGGGARAYTASAKEYDMNRMMRVAILRGGEDFLGALSDLAIGDAIFRAIQALSQFASVEAVDVKRKIKTIAVLDTPIVMGALAYSYDYRNVACTQIVNMCRNLGMRIGVLSISIDEMERIFSAAATNIAHGNALTGEIRSYIFEHGLDAASLIDERGMIRDRVGSEFEILEPPPLTVGLSISEAELETQIAENVKQRYPDARKHDVEALAAVYRFRKGEAKVYFENADAILITSNKSLADSSTVFFQEMFRKDGKRNQVQVCMHQTVFASRLWVKLPTISAEVARPLIIAQVYASLQPNPKLRDAFLTELKRLSEKGLISAESEALVRISHFADEVLGDRFSYDKISINERDTKNVISSTMEKIKAWQQSQKGKIAEEFSRTIESLSGEVLDFERRALDAETDAEEKRHKAIEMEQKVEATLAKVEGARVRVRKAVGRIYWICVCVFFLTLCYLASGSVMEDKTVTWNDAKWILFLVVTGVFAALDRVHQLRDVIERRVASIILGEK